MIVVSHRGPVRFSYGEGGGFVSARGAGGVVSALTPLLARHEYEATWYAAAMTPADTEAQAAGATTGLGIDLELIHVDPVVHRMHYNTVANGALWFLFHGMFDHIRRPRFDLRFRDAWDAYVEVNRVFANAVAGRAADGDVVLVQDYQLALVPSVLRELRPDLHVSHFMHTPFCDAQDARVLPTDIGEQLLRALASGPQGFHTARWARAYERSAREILGPDAPAHAPFVASLGPDEAALEQTATSEVARQRAASLAERVGDLLVVLRTDRTEPSKNIVRGFLAFDRLLEARPGLRRRVVFVAMVHASRQGLPEYLAYANEVEQAALRVNDRWATRDWLPVLLDDGDDYPRSVAGLQRYDVLLVNPIRDGLNLVAKEGPVVNRRDGVLCLSREAGAYEELHEAVVPVHPFDIEQMAVALDDALSMPLDERAAMAKRLRTLAGARTPRDWLSDLLAHTRDEPA